MAWHSCQKVLFLIIMQLKAAKKAAWVFHAAFLTNFIQNLPLPVIPDRKLIRIIAYFNRPAIYLFTFLDFICPYIQCNPVIPAYIKTGFCNVIIWYIF